MNAKEIQIRPATIADAAIIARAVTMGIGDKEALVHYCGTDYVSVLTAIATKEGTQYSWQNALIADVDGQAAGVIVAYDGARLYELREGTLKVVMEKVGRIPVVADETQSGEYYIDTLAVMPEFRGIGVGKMLIKALCSKVHAKGYACVGLIVDNQNLRAQALYSSLGFKQVGLTPFFGHLMYHLQRIQL